MLARFQVTCWWTKEPVLFFVGMDSNQDLETDAFHAMGIAPSVSCEALKE